MSNYSESRERWIAVVWLLAGIGMLVVAFTTQVPNREFMQMMIEKSILERQNKPHDHLDPDKLERFRPAWKNPLFIFGLGSIMLAGMQFALNSRTPRGRTDRQRTP